MSIRKIAAVACAGLMLALSLASCGGEKAPDINVNVKAVTNDAATIFDTPITISGDANVLDGIEAACEKNEIDITFSDDEDAVKSIGDYDSVDNFYWYFKVNGKEVSGTALDNVVADGMNIEYIYAEATSRSVTFRVVVDGETVVEEEVTEGLLVNIIEEACDSYELSDDGKTVEDIGDYETYSDDTTDYYWVYRLNGKKVEDFNASEDEIKGGSTVEFTYVAEEK